jgi:hypothetical protein
MKPEGLLARLFAVAITAAAASSACAADTLTVIPAQPKYLEPVYLRIHPEQRSFHVQAATVSLNGNTLEVQYNYVVDLCCSLPFDVMLGRLPAGRYTVVTKTKLFGQTGSTEFTVAAGSADIAPGGAAKPSVNYTDLWWNPAESGWGLNIVQGPTDLIFATWFVYDAHGRPTWYTLQPGGWDGPRIYRGIIFKTSGPGLGGPFDPSAVTETAVGSGSLNFTSFDTASFSYSVEGVSTFKRITRLPIQ